MVTKRERGSYPSHSIHLQGLTASDLDFCERRSIKNLLTMIPINEMRKYQRVRLKRDGIIERKKGNGSNLADGTFYVLTELGKEILNETDD